MLVDMLTNLCEIQLFNKYASINKYAVINSRASFLGFDNFKRKHKKLRLLPRWEISMEFGSDFQGKKGSKDPNQRKNTLH